MYEGTGLRTGDIIPQLVGDEYDRTFGLDTPAPVDVVARSPLVTPKEGRGSVRPRSVRPERSAGLRAATIFWAKVSTARCATRGSSG